MDGQPQTNHTLSRKKKIVFTLIMVILTFLFCSLAYFGTILWRSSRFYKERPSMTGHAYQADKDLGFILKPNSFALASLWPGEYIPMVSDQNGFRVPKKNPQINLQDKGGILFLGCSFTYGAFLPAEKSFSFIAAKKLNVRCMNAAVSGGGLCQMVLRAQKEIPKHKPQYVVVQYSPWLIKRSQRYYRPTKYAKTPGPYFYESRGKIFIHPPVFLTKSFDLPISKYIRKSLLAFTWNVGIPLYLHDDYFVLLTSIKRLIGILPKPAKSREAIVRFAYKEIEKVCRAHGSIMLVLKVHMGIVRRSSHDVDDLGLFVIDTYEPLASRLPRRTNKAWKRKYSFFRGNPPRLVNIHPNAEAHRIIANTIVDKIMAFKQKK